MTEHLKKQHKSASALPQSQGGTDVRRVPEVDGLQKGLVFQQMDSGRGEV